MSFDIITRFEKEIANFYGAPYGVSVDCCTHAIELCLIHTDVEKIIVPKRTYVSVPLLSKKLGIELEWKNEDWDGYYYIGGTNIVDAAVLWKRDSYIAGTFMCLSFQYRKHLSLGRGGMILTDNAQSAAALRKMSYDGRERTVPWREQNINSMGYHYYMTPETAQRGIEALPEAISREPKKWTVNDWPDLTKMEIFK